MRTEELKVPSVHDFCFILLEYVLTFSDASEAEETCSWSLIEAAQEKRSRNPTTISLSLFPSSHVNSARSLTNRDSFLQTAG